MVGQGTCLGGELSELAGIVARCGPKMTTVFEDCNYPLQIVINYTHSYDTTCDKDTYITEMASRVIQAMDTSQCGHDADHNLRNDGGADHNRDTKLVHNAGDDDDFSRHARNYDCSSDLDN
ncbi:hypothetical protein AAVH_20675 [Aphelenchoides avenae]|nr:hypothetical protein AAVH_20675 [Aphelenchus avenae]